ncbi:MAG: hypothetical protein ACI3W5_07510 [Faecousia sp.]
MKIGDNVRKRITFGSGFGLGKLKADDQAFTGTVIWVHPLGRFYVVEFKGPIGTIRESYREEHYGR